MNLENIKNEYLASGYVVVDKLLSKEAMQDLLRTSMEIEEFINEKNEGKEIDPLHCVVQPHNFTPTI